ncbi:MAG: type II secretion system protein GspG [Planctomycetota bacterium]
MSCAKSRRRAPRTRGSMFMLAIVTAALIALAVGAAAPTIGIGLRQDFEDEARAEICALRAGIEAYFEDNEGFPPTLPLLLHDSPATPNWLGPYVEDGFQDQRDTTDDALHDPWRNPYVYYWPSPWTALVRSRGANGIDEAGGGDDIELRFRIDYVLWLITMRELRILRPSIAAYNAHVAPPSLPGPWVAVVNRLQAKNILPKGPDTKFDFRSDGWGNYYVPTGSPCDGVISLGPPY